MNSTDIAALLQAKFPDVHAIPQPAGQTRGTETYLDVPAARLLEAAQFLKSDALLSFDVLTFATAIDWKTHFEMVYYLDSTLHRHKAVLKVKIDNREAPEVHTVTGLWPTADWQEREVWDLFGIRITGHYNLRRILLPDNWEGYPMRKDYVATPDRYD
jgi:NADH-quinone oxidoreductase subunit C